MNKKNFAVIGLGRIGKMHLELILKNFPNYQLKTIVENRPLNDAQKAWLSKWGLEHTVTTELNDVLNDKDTNMVFIACSTAEQPPITQALLRAGKAIFCEKPAAITIEDMDQIIKTVEETNGYLQIGYNRRFDPHFYKLKQEVDAGKIGNIYMVKIINRDPRRPSLDFIPKSGGLHLDFTVHDFDMIRYMVGCEAREIYSVGSALIDEEIAKLGDIDTAITTLKMENNVLCVIDNSREAMYGYDQQIEVFGSKGSIRVNNVSPTNTILSTNEGVMTEKPHFSFVERYVESYIHQFEQFFKHVEEKKASPVLIEDAKWAIKLAIAAKRSLEDNKPVAIKDAQLVSA